MRDGLVNDQIKQQILQALEPIVKNEHPYGNGDLKETVLLLTH